MISVGEIDAVILCGGLGTRLRSVVSDKPKVMAEVAGSPFLDLHIQNLKQQGIERFILCTGYMAEDIERYYREHHEDVVIDFSREEQPLGTGGAIVNAAEIIDSNPFLVINGDSFCPFNAEDLLKAYSKTDGLATILVSSVKGNKDYGSVLLNDKSEVCAFQEKKETDKDILVNVGVYCLNRKALKFAPDQEKFSIEYDWFPKMIGHGFYGHVIKEEFFDIGTPERYELAKRKIKIND